MSTSRCSTNECIYSSPEEWFARLDAGKAADEPDWNFSNQVSSDQGDAGQDDDTTVVVPGEKAFVPVAGEDDGDDEGNVPELSPVEEAAVNKMLQQAVNENQMEDLQKIVADIFGEDNSGDQNGDGN